jgi:hypothetical protein
MSIHASLSPEARRNIEARDLTSGGEVSFLRILDLAEEVANSQFDNGKTLGLIGMMNNGIARLNEIAEQRRLLHAILTGEIQPVCKGERNA